MRESAAPFFKSWKKWYWLVLLFMLFQVILYYFLSEFLK